MEWKFRLNWQALVEEAKQRRKAQNLTQQRLATLAEVSAPTVSRFEGGEKDIQLSSVLRILEKLGMVDERVLTFPEPRESYSEDELAVKFWGMDRETEIRCAIRRDVLMDRYRGDSKNLLKAFAANRAAIEHEARRKYLAGKLESSGSIVIRNDDL